jgi:hypothetical protein
MNIGFSGEAIAFIPNDGRVSIMQDIYKHAGRIRDGRA